MWRYLLKKTFAAIEAHPLPQVNVWYASLWLVYSRYSMLSKSIIRFGYVPNYKYTDYDTTYTCNC